MCGSSYILLKNRVGRLAIFFFECQNPEKIRVFTEIVSGILHSPTGSQPVLTCVGL